MIKVLVGDLFDSKMQTLVNTVNCVGIMGKGIALEFKRRFPEMYKDYVARCKRAEVKLGQPYLYKQLTLPWILNFPTKDHWRSLTKLDDVINGLEYFSKNYQEWGITSIAFPPLGSGLGQLEWGVVGPILFKHLSTLPIEVELYAPYGTPEDELKLSFLSAQNKGQLTLKRPNFEWISPAWFALVEILKRVEDQPYHPAVGRTSFQKMAYVAKSAGLPLDVEFAKGTYGPYAKELGLRVNRLISNKLISESKSGPMMRVEVGSSYQSALATYFPEIQTWEPIIEKVSDLFMRANTTQAELIATIIFSANSLTAKKQSKPSEKEVVEEVLEWKQLRYAWLNKNNVAIAVRNLGVLEWLSVEPSEELFKETP